MMLQSLQTSSPAASLLVRLLLAVLLLGPAVWAQLLPAPSDPFVPSSPSAPSAPAAPAAPAVPSAAPDAQPSNVPAAVPPRPSTAANPARAPAASPSSIVATNSGRAGSGVDVSRPVLTPDTKKSTNDVSAGSATTGKLNEKARAMRASNDAFGTAFLGVLGGGLLVVVVGGAFINKRLQQSRLEHELATRKVDLLPMHVPAKDIYGDYDANSDDSVQNINAEREIRVQVRRLSDAGSSLSGSSMSRPPLGRPISPFSGSGSGSGSDASSIKSADSLDRPRHLITPPARSLSASGRSSSSRSPTSPTAPALPPRRSESVRQASLPRTSSVTSASSNSRSIARHNTR
ncbi:hypothetical protein BC831DRAFT_434406 [Entophlyctis helioformis]|nr:hypothetical protein BC831DRAFT_434406 [Entophlyctis helioformis]